MFNNQKGLGIITGIFLFLLLLVAIVVASTYYWFRQLTPEKIVNLTQSDMVKKYVKPEDKGMFDSIPLLLGFTKPMTYLILFENNTELRPAGGFIGVYAVVKMDKGKMELVKVEGTENLDKQTPAEWHPEPPRPIKEHLKVDRWYFRDSNWSPDFAMAAQKAMELYQGERGVRAEEINAVIGFTPQVVEELLKITGPITIQDIEFKSDNVTEKLEYEVEYGYDDKGLAFHERKQIIQPFMLELISRLKKDVFLNLKNYANLAYQVAEQRQLLFYSQDNNLQKEFRERNWTGEVKNYDGDYLLWVDANLAALKTDNVMKRTLHYNIVQEKEGRWLATVRMDYQHLGRFDWRTTRYRTYARVYVPSGAEFVTSSGSMKWDRTKEPGQIDQGEELGKKWFGTFIAIEPQKQGSLSFSYYLPQAVIDQIKKGFYNLSIQKQLGTLASGLTLELNFGKTIVSSTPGGVVKDGTYWYKGDLKVDRKFDIVF